MFRSQKPLISLILTGLFASSLVTAVDTHNSFGFQKLNHSLCQTVANDNVLAMRSVLRKANVHIRAIYPQVQCDKSTLLSYAIQHKSDNIIQYLQRKAKPEQPMQIDRVAKTRQS